MASDQPVIIKKVKKGGGHGHHGGAWKVAYADFVTAMMAFFLMMWLINNTEPEQREGIADYFAPASVSRTTSGSGGVLGGTAFGDEGARGSGAASVVDRLAPRPAETREREQQTTETEASESQPEVTIDAVANALARREAAEFASAEQSLRQALMDMPELAELSRHVIIEETPEGLRIQLIDEEGRPMFQPGQIEPNERARVLLRAVGEIAQTLPNRITISGHTDASPAPRSGPSNWELSSARANSALNVLLQTGIPDHRIAEVRGKAGAEPLFPDDPYLPGNRRLSITLLREAPVIPPGHSL